MILVAVTVSIVTFALIHFTGDLAMSIGGLEATGAEVERIRAFYGLDRSLPVQYVDWAARALGGDFGRSFFSREPVFDMVVQRLPVTVALALAALTLGLAIAVPLGVLAATRPGSWIDRACLAIAVIGQAMPSYWSALLLILLFGVTLQWLPISGTDGWQSFILPTIALGWFVMPVLMRLTRAGMVEVLRADYVRTARAKGLPTRLVLFKHALRNAILPVISAAMVQLGVLLGGSIVVESVFALNGIGLLAFNSIQRSDFPVVQAIVLIVAVLFVALMFLADLVNALLDPRIRVG
ncbi:MAG: ABC transporter permease [Alphaproteobacteria bacterium]|nr:ABC transporter permease [Alphaproteobacteria bacterium]